MLIIPLGLVTENWRHRRAQTEACQTRTLDLNYCDHHSEDNVCETQLPHTVWLIERTE